MLYTLISFLVFFWAACLVRNVGGPYVHALLILAVAISLYNVIGGRRSPKFD